MAAGSPVENVDIPHSNTLKKVAPGVFPILSLLLVDHLPDPVMDV